MTQEVTIHAIGDATNGWKVDIEDGLNKDTWTPPGAQVEDAIVTAVGDHVAKYGHNVPVKPAVRSEADQKETDSLTKQRDDTKAELADAKKTLADAQDKIKELSAKIPASVLTPVVEPAFVAPVPSIPPHPAA